MQKTFYFMSGLPRSGSTVLSAILNQNPRFYSGPSSPVTGLMLLMEQALSNDELFLAHPKPEQAGQIIANILPQYYSNINKPVIFDKNRSWINRLHYIEGYFGFVPKVLCPVRSIDEILTSFISMHKRNPHEVNGKINFLDEMLIKSNIPLTHDNRCEFLASENGILGQSYNGIKDALIKGQQSYIHFIEYKDLVNSPENTLGKIYDFLEEEPFEHTFENLGNINEENDANVYGFADMHEIRKKLHSISEDPRKVLSVKILEKCKDLEFWRSIDETYDAMEEFADKFIEKESLLFESSNIISK
jgi:sulfotransferase